MRYLLLLAGTLVLTACSYRLPVHTPEVSVLPAVVYHGGQFSVRLWGAGVARYRFMGAVRGANDTWVLRLDPAEFEIFYQVSQFSVREGDILPLGAGPTVLVQFVSISPTQLKLQAVEPQSTRSGP